MNKKFSTLVAALGLASMVSYSVQAATISAGTRDVTKIEANRVYQLGNADGSKVLVMVPVGNGFTLKLKPVASVTDLNSTLWTIQTTYENAATGPDFSFVNKATGLPLSVDPSKAALYDASHTYAASDGYVEMTGSTSAWKWKTTTETISSPFGTSGLVSYFTKDSIVTLVTGATASPGATGNGYADSEDVYLVKSVASRDKWEGRHLRIAPLTASEVVLSAKDLNTLMGTDLNSTSFKLSSNKTTSDNSKLGNVFRDNTFRAWNMCNKDNGLSAYAENQKNFIQYVNTNLTTDASNTVGDDKHVFLQIIDNDANNDDPLKDTYLLADTSYITGTATNLELVKFGKDQITTGEYGGKSYLNEAKAGRDIQSYMFKFTYFPTQDSIAISVKSYMKANSAESDVNGKSTIWNVATTDKNVVTLNRLTEVTEVTLTDADPAANVRFYLGAGNDNRISEANGLYYIKNAKGQYLAVPINEEGYDEAKWVTVKPSEQNVAHMPAYQWVILKNMEQSSDIAKVSHLAIANREFPGVKADAVQLYKNSGATYKFAAVNDLFATTDSVVFDQIKDEKILGDEKLGYKSLNTKDLSVKTYKLNYLHPYATDKYIGKNATDSLLSVLDTETAFYLKEVSTKKYGFEVTEDVADRIEGLKQLKRTAYVPYVKSVKGDMGINVNEEDQYYLAPVKTLGSFYFKENNQYKPEGADAARCYYALIDLTKGTAADSSKVGTTDDDMAAILKNQVLNETRTSAFAIMESNVPLYRRFNTALEGVASDEADTLRFKEYYRGEYLMDENNEKFQNKGVNYVGIERADKATGLSFIVDTAIVYTTSFGQIKPQYFIYVNKQVKDAEPAIDCDATNHKHVDANGKETTADKCVHATPAKAGFVRAQYMVSFADSLQSENADELYKFGKYTRVGFVDGLHIGDSLYILTNGFEKKALADLDTAEIKAAYADAKITNHIIDLKAGRTDKHHNYTWSFRFIDPEKAAAATEESKDVAFLIESNKGDANDVAPKMGAWLKSQNGCLVLSETTSTFDNAKTGGDNALIFNIEVGTNEDLATDNEEIATSTINVTAGEGNVTIAGAQGKKVVISNVLGQVIANTVITSDNATIAAPAGVVVVAVEGEAAVKAMVK